MPTPAALQCLICGAMTPAPALSCHACGEATWAPAPSDQDEPAAPVPVAVPPQQDLLNRADRRSLRRNG